MERQVGAVTTFESDPAPRFQAAPALISLRGARAAYCGPALNLAPHRNAVAVAALSLGAPFKLQILDHEGRASPPRSCLGGFIPAGALHHVHATGPMAFLYLDPAGDDEKAAHCADFAAAAQSISECADASADVDRLCRALRLPKRDTADPRAAALLRALDADPDAFPTMRAASQAVGLSPSRCRALLREAVGVPLRRYRLWRRMAQAVQTAARSGSLARAAHEAGFSSSAHFSAAFKAMFGLAPSLLLRPGVRFDFG